MLERLALFLPSIGICLVIAAIAYVVCGRVQKYIKIKSKDDPEWVRKNPNKTYWMMVTPAFLIWAPFFEEAVFRGVLIIFFESITLYAVAAIMVSAAIFAYAHKSSVVEYHEQAYAKESSEGKTAEQILQERKDIDRKIKEDFRQKLKWTFAGGIIFGLAGVGAQSIYASVFCHFLWNFDVVLLAFVIQKILGLPPDIMIQKNIYRPRV